MARRIHRALADDIRRMREDAGISRNRLAGSAGIDSAYLDRIEEGGERPSIDIYAKLAIALGADLSGRLYPNTGPLIRDRHQAPILEHLLRELDPRWRPYPEVGVRRPSRGWIDVVLHDPIARVVVATEIQSDLKRIEQQVRWFGAKAESLPSWEGWAHLGDISLVSRLLIVKATRTTREIGQAFEQQLAVAYPGHPEDAVAALAGRAAWPGAALVWVDLDASGVRFVRRRRLTGSGPAPTAR